MDVKSFSRNTWVNAALVQHGPGGTRWPVLAPFFATAPPGFPPDLLSQLLTRAARAGQLDAVTAGLKLRVQPENDALRDLCFQINLMEEVAARAADPLRLAAQLACARALMAAGAQVHSLPNQRTPLDDLLDAPLAPGAELACLPFYDLGWRCWTYESSTTPEQASWLKAWQQNKPLFSLALEARGVRPPLGSSTLMFAAFAGATVSTQTALDRGADPEKTETLGPLSISPLDMAAHRLRHEPGSIPHQLNYALLEAAALTRRLAATPLRIPRRAL